MRIASLLTGFLLPFLLSATYLFAHPQQIDSGAHPGDRIYLDVVVTPQSGPAIRSLQQRDFTIFDNNIPQPIASFESAKAQQAHLSLFIIFDTLALSPRAKGTALEDIKRFLTTNGGELPYSTTIAFVTDKGLQYIAGPSRDGEALGSSFDKNSIQTQLLADAVTSYPVFNAFAAFVALERNEPGRKVVLFVSPGWPPVRRSDFDNTATAKEIRELRQQMFENVVQLTKQLRDAQITIYSIDPPAVDDADSGFTNGVTHLSGSGSDPDLIPVRSPSDIRWSDLTLQALVARSGGLTLSSGNDLAANLRQCVADASSSYQLSFDPILTDSSPPYHYVQVEIAQPDLTARTLQGYYSQYWTGAKSAVDAESSGDTDAPTSQVPALDMQDASESRTKNLAAKAPTYANMSLGQLIKKVPDLKGIQPSENQTQLPMILEKFGASVDDFIHNVGDLIADEDLTQQKLNPDGKIKAKLRTQDDYLILHHGYEWGANAEYRMDKKGKRLGAIGLEKGYLVTAGYALSSISFGTTTQAQSNYRYLGDQKVGARDAFVVAFAQRPGEVTFTTVMKGTGDHEVDMLTQGILWIDKENFQILRLRTDLLEPNPELHLTRSTTDVSFSQFHLQNTPDPLWLPNDVTVFLEINGEKYRNLHHYSNYRRYQVAVKIGSS